jgi:pimeloyl-ACP methyl ester carboxylesterase
MGLLIPAVEDRINVVILFLGGFPDTPIPEADVPNYTPHIKVPTLMLNGMYDVFYPLETSVRPAFDFLGTPKDQKRLVVYETDHYIPTREMVRESLIWLDRYLGPVKMPP